MRLSIFGTKIYISFMFCAFAAIILIQDKTLTAMPLIAAVAAHELAHLICMILLGVSPKEIRLVPTGIEILGTKAKRIKDEIIIAIAGPAVNLAVAAVLTVYYVVYLKPNELIWAFVWFFIGVFNLLPSYGLDGGTILFNICLSKYSVAKSELILKITTLITALGLIALGMYYVFVVFNPTFLIMGLYLLILYLIKI